MAFLTCNIFSNALGKATNFNAILPQDCNKNTKVLFLLHGLSDDHTAWVRYTALEQMVRNYNLAVFMPDGSRMFYCNVGDGTRCLDYVSQELPDVITKMFNVSASRENTFIAGQSMGGYGAMKVALNFPERFSAAVSLSGSLRNQWMRQDFGPLHRFDFGPEDEYNGSINDIFAAAKNLANDATKPRPRLYMTCGTEDFLYADNIAFRDYLRTLGLKIDYRESPGAHTWEFWNAELPALLAWLMKDSPNGEDAATQTLRSFGNK